jgi:hypothetical protein
MSRKISPELREAIRQTNEEGRQARAFLQGVLDRHEARRIAAYERHQRRQQLLRRLTPFRRSQ